MLSGSIKVIRKMSVFTSAPNPVSGQSEWIVQDKDYDHLQETARSSFADMLHDTERNKLYEEALKRVLNKFDRPCRVLDIGTGTGLLSMMAARHGAQSVAACETFLPMAKIAARVIELNGLSNKIQVISKRSTDMNADEIVRADVCVAEVFDTELIGEGALRTFLDAHRDLLKMGARIIPSKGRVFVQPIQSDSATAWFRPLPVQIDAFNISINPACTCAQCPGSSAVHDIQLQQFDTSLYDPVSDPIQIFQFNFESPTIALDECETFSLKKADWSSAIRADALLFWWELDMDGTGQLILSTKPSPNSQWRDHWMQAVYPLPKSVPLSSRLTFNLFAAHDEYSFWFHLFQDKNISNLERPYCTCGLHTIHSRVNLSRFNDIQRYTKWAQALQLYKTQVGTCTALCYSDCSLLPLIAAQLGIKVVTVEKNKHARQIIENYVDDNRLETKVIVEKHWPAYKNDNNKQPDLVMADPFYFSSILPWHNLHFWYFVQEHFPISNVICMPKRAELWCVPMEFDNLHKIRLPVGQVQGFDLTAFDELAQKCMSSCDASIEPHPLWEYPGLCVGDPSLLLCWGAPNDPLSDLQNAIKLVMNRPANAIAFWMKWWLNDDIFVSTGIEGECVIGEMPRWDPHSTQGVMFLTVNTHTQLQLDANFVASTASINISTPLQYKNLS